MSEFDRRTFIKGTAAVVAGLGLSGVVNDFLAQNVKAASVPDKWDEDYDVVVIGSGTGALAAVVARDFGLRSVILEKANKFGGTTAKSGGGMWIPNNYVMQQEGVEDSFEDALEYMRKATFDQSDEESMRTYLTEAPKMLEYLHQNGLEFQFLMGTGLAFQDYYDNHFDGARNHGRVVQSVKGGGSALMEEIRVLAERRGVPIHLETPATKLVVDETGAIIGVYAKKASGQEVAIRARRGVLMAAGGFSHNETMVKHFLRGPLYYPSAAETCTGDGILMGMGVGADLRNMNEVFGWPVEEITIGSRKMGIPDAGYDRGRPGTIMVNRYGQRFCNESSNYDSITRTFYWWDNGTFDYRNIPGFLIVDSENRKRYTLGGMKPGMEQPWMNRSDSLEELAGKLGIDSDGLKATVDTFNRFAKEGKDPYFHRGEFSFDIQTCGDASRTDLRNPVLAPIAKPPFYGVRVYPGALTTAGGLRINSSGQVLKPTGEAIPGLYATGVNSGNVMGAGYPGGGGPVGSGMTFSYISAKHMAHR